MIKLPEPKRRNTEWGYSADEVRAIIADRDARIAAFENASASIPDTVSFDARGMSEELVSKAHFVKMVGERDLRIAELKAVLKGCLRPYITGQNFIIGQR